jgi:hypothetical protein
VRKEMKGGASPLALTAPINAVATTMTVTGTVTGWPKGVSHPFVIVIDRGTVSEEKCLCATLSGAGPATITVTQRGFDDTAAVAHSTAATVEHCLDAATLSELVQHMYDAAGDNHTQYIKTDGTRAFTGVTAIAGNPASVSTANAAGTALTLARSDHVHQLGTGAVDTPAKLVDNVIRNQHLADDILDLTHFPDQVRPIVVIANSAARSALTPVDGDMVYQVDIRRMLSYRANLTAWTPIDSTYTQLTPTWANRTSDGDLYNTGALVAADYYRRLLFQVCLYVNPSDNDNWDCQIQLRTAAAGGGNLLGESSFRNGGLNSREAVVFPCSPLDVAAGATPTLYLYANYSTATPSVGFTPTAAGLGRQVILIEDTGTAG